MLIVGKNLFNILVDKEIIDISGNFIYKEKTPIGYKNGKPVYRRSKRRI